MHARGMANYDMPCRSCEVVYTLVKPFVQYIIYT